MKYAVEHHNRCLFMITSHCVVVHQCQCHYLCSGMSVHIVQTVVLPISSEAAKNSQSKCGLLVALLFDCLFSWLLLSRAFGEKDEDDNEMVVV